MLVVFIVILISFLTVSLNYEKYFTSGKTENVYTTAKL